MFLNCDCAMCGSYCDPGGALCNYCRMKEDYRQQKQLAEEAIKVLFRFSGDSSQDEFLKMEARMKAFELAGQVMIYRPENRLKRLIELMNR